MSHRIREAMRVGGVAPMGGAGEIVEADETYLSASTMSAPSTVRPQGGHARAQDTSSVRLSSAAALPVASMSRQPIATVMPIVRANIASETCMMTDEAALYRISARICQPRDRQAQRRGIRALRRSGGYATIHTNTVEGYFSIFKRGMKGVYQHCSEKHLHRYLGEFDFRYSHRVRLASTM